MVHLGRTAAASSTLIKTIREECYPLAARRFGDGHLGRERWDIFELRKHLGTVSPEPADILARRIRLGGMMVISDIQQHTNFASPSTPIICGAPGPRRAPRWPVWEIGQLPERPLVQIVRM